MTEPVEENASTKLSGYVGVPEGEVEPGTGSGFPDEEGGGTEEFAHPRDISDTPVPQRRTDNF